MTLIYVGPDLKFHPKAIPKQRAIQQHVYCPRNYPQYTNVALTDCRLCDCCLGISATHVTCAAPLAQPYPQPEPVVMLFDS